MVLELPGGLFTQTDVRETPISTATATAVGLTGESYVLVGAGSADLTAERTLTAGTGVSITDGGVGTTVTLATVDGDIIHDNLSGFVAAEHVVISAGEGIDVAAGVVSGEDASTTNKGIASFSTNDFTVSSGAVSLKNKTSYLSIPPAAWTAAFPDADDITIALGYINPSAGTIEMKAPVNLPHGAVVTGVIVYGNASAASGETWSLRRLNLSGATDSVMASAAFNTEDTTITDATIDNNQYSYCLYTGSIDSSDIIYSGRITYTTDYD